MLTGPDFDDALSILSNGSLYLDADEVNDDIIGPETREKVPLYEGAPVTLDETLLLTLVFAMRHHLPGIAIVHLLKLISLICKKVACTLKPTLYFFQKHFSHLKAPVKFHYFCSDCFERLSKPSSKCKNEKRHKNRTLCSYYLEMDLEEQIKTHFKRKGFAENLQHRFTKEKMNPLNIEDIYDSQLYRELVESGFLGEDNKFNFTLTWSTDGVPVFDSSKTSMWPVYFVFNELPFKMRFKKENIMLGGIWYGHKPRHNLMIEPFLSSLKKVRKGVEVQLYGSNEKIISKGILICGTADLLAKADLLGLKHPGGAYACAVCKLQGKSVNSNKEDDKVTIETGKLCFHRF